MSPFKNATTLAQAIQNKQITSADALETLIGRLETHNPALNDVLLMPVASVPAFPHNQSGNVLNRTLEINGRSEPYGHVFSWIALATAAGLPATSAPIGQTAAGLPINIQIIAPHLEDHTAIAFADHLSTLIGGFTPPPSYE